MKEVAQPDYRTLPSELLKIIVGYVDNTYKPPDRIKALRSLALTSRNLSGITSPILFKFAKWGNVGEYRAQARFYSLAAKRKIQIGAIDSKQQKMVDDDKGGVKTKGDDLASFVQNLDVMVEIPAPKPSVNWLRDRRISDLRELIAIDRFPNFTRVTSLNIRSAGGAGQAELKEMRQSLQEVIRLLSHKLTHLTLDMASVLTLFQVKSKKFDKEIKDQEWPENLQEFTFNLDHLTDLETVSERDLNFPYVSNIFKVMRKRKDGQKISLRFDFGPVFGHSTCIVMKLLLNCVFMEFLRNGHERKDEPIKQKMERHGLRLCLRGGLKLADSEGGWRASFLEEGLFELEGDLAGRSLAQFRDPQ